MLLLLLLLLYGLFMLLVCCYIRAIHAGSFPHTPRGGVNTPNFRTTPPRLQGEMREIGEGEGGGKGKGEEKRSEGTPKVG